MNKEPNFRELQGLVETTRQCDGCTKCCEWRTDHDAPFFNMDSLDEYGKRYISNKIQPEPTDHSNRIFGGIPCHYCKVGVGCTIWEERHIYAKDFCNASYDCGWKREENLKKIPEWMKPDKSDVIIVPKKWTGGEYWSVVECGVPIRGDVLNWLISYCGENGINLQYRVNGEVYQRGTEEFFKFITKIQPMLVNNVYFKKDDENPLHENE